ncbi:MAG: polysaccharide deacetylase family protein [bacterium]|nr:polysaccharide deacetylase family protein [bacterium]
MTQPVGWRHILNFHGIGPNSRDLDPGEDEVWLEEAAFEAILDVIRPQDRVGLTFDDGNMSDLEVALPHLLRRKLEAEFFISTDKIGSHGYLDESQLRKIAAAGMRVGSHGVSHSSWREFDAAGLRDELVASRDVLGEILGECVERAACPLGAYDRRVLRELHRSHYTRVYTSDGGLAHESQWLQARTSLGPGDSPASIRRLLGASRWSPDNLSRRFKTAIKRRR